MGAKRVAVLGATGLVGREMLYTLEQRKFPVSELIPLASPRSAGKKVVFNGEEIEVRAVNEDSFKGVDIALFSAGGKTSKQWAPVAAASGAVVIDNSSAWRMDPEVPLIVPEINAGDVSMAKNKGIIANPNCSTIQAVVVLYPLHKAAGLKYINISTYQSVAGTGKAAIESLRDGAKAAIKGEEYGDDVYPHNIAFNLLPHIGPFDEEGISEEEWKMVNESRKIMHIPGLRVSGITVRVPIFRCHGESVTAQFERPLSPAEAREILKNAPGVVVRDDPKNAEYPMPIETAGKDDVCVGRIRRDTGLDNALAMWVVGDNLRKGAALNAVQIAEKLL
ncbi:aspartate-semialdehyde dehydrogenase [Cloacibacillus evryensis]|uniref:Aspartate-semialdehyde dehydrogenase n=1 Tax=Cloacibacillus evryensis TaxID=508460 RepID=A0AAW5K2S0_9BACT|nr:aspartate-semialdehyde dehydrogenase [Cloacibacillus evryensis]EHL65970.1 aspartate-semialdehyde dehydrogenase [Synergistes sp. 3_1_syn1]MCQ4814006.1 aspartate-semialdehyde dehydrogenase [Cloacibacillus evryensis]MEA5034387.1 aspartate-semialdehyde dehydrogenase [Cloacibacillus evryensis]